MPKQYLPLAGRTLIEWALAPFLDDARCHGIIVALAPDDRRFAALPLARHPRLRTVAGGRERSDSVRQALQALSAADGANASDWVLVHDAARPCVSAVEIDALLGMPRATTVGAVLAVPVADTLKRPMDRACVSQTEDRTALWRALTPQMFRVGLLRSALDQASEAGACPPTNHRPWSGWDTGRAWSRGNARNIKVTEPGDLALAGFILSHGSAGT